MHLSDGVLSTTMIAATSLGGVGMVALALRGIKTEEISKIALMTAVFLVGSTIHLPIGPTSVHLMLTGFIGLVIGNRTPIAVLIALLLQLFLLHQGGFGSLGANVLIQSVPAMLLGALFRSRLATANGGAAFGYGFATGLASIAGSTLLLALVLILSHQRYVSTVFVVIATQFVLMFVEGICTAFAVQFIVGVRPRFFQESTDETSDFDNSPVHRDDG
jgi:cobalt/nickel transport system permease protein